MDLSLHLQLWHNTPMNLSLTQPSLSFPLLAFAITYRCALCNRTSTEKDSLCEPIPNIDPNQEASSCAPARH
jgi:hypothetical protein